MKIEVSNGELIDKLTILEIKLDNITEPEKIKHVKVEHEMLRKYATELLNDPALLELFNSLKLVNSQLWSIEDQIREKERQNSFGERFVELARLVYHTNDKRFDLKNQINTLTRSELQEMKSYTSY
jgi:hypothetical protein